MKLSLENNEWSKKMKELQSHKMKGSFKTLKIKVTEA